MTAELKDKDMRRVNSISSKRMRIFQFQASINNQSYFLQPRYLQLYIALSRVLNKFSEMENSYNKENGL